MTKKNKKEDFVKKVGALPSPAKPAEDGAPGRERRTNEEIAKDRDAQVRKILVDRADPVLIPLVKMLFNAWPATILPTIPYEDIYKKAEQTLFITEPEAQNIAIPLTQLKNYYLPNINPIWFAWGNLASALYGFTSVRLQVLRDFRVMIAERKKAEKPEGEPCVCKTQEQITVENKGICSVCHRIIVPPPSK